MEQDVIFTNPYRKRKSDEDQCLEVSETKLVFSTFGRKAIYRTKKRDYSCVSSKFGFVNNSKSLFLLINLEDITELKEVVSRLNN